MSEKEKINQMKMDLLATSIAIQLRGRFHKDEILYFKNKLSELLQEDDLFDFSGFGSSDVILTVVSTPIEPY